MRSNTSGEDLKGSVSPSKQHFHAFLAFIAFIAFGASAAAFLAPFFAMLLKTGKLKQWGMHVSSKTSFLEPDGRRCHHTMHHKAPQRDNRRLPQGVMRNRFHFSPRNKSYVICLIIVFDAIFILFLKSRITQKL